MTAAGTTLVPWHGGPALDCDRSAFLPALILVSTVTLLAVLAGGSFMDTPFPLLTAVLAAVLTGAWARPSIVPPTCTVAAVLMTIANQRAHPGDYSVANDLLLLSPRAQLRRGRRVGPTPASAVDRTAASVS